MGLLFNLVQQMAVFAVIAYVISKTRIFSPLIRGTVSGQSRVKLYLVFSAITIMGTYLGTPIHDAIANTRAIGAVMAGLLGGPALGIAVGATGGIHRFLLGGFTAFSCGVSTTAEGLIGGLIHLYIIRRHGREGLFDYRTAFFATFVSEVVQMLLILALSRPFTEALALVEIIALPMVLANSFGSALFVSILKDRKNMAEAYGAEFSRQALKIAERTLGILSGGLNKRTANELVHTLLKATGVGAVAVTDTETVLAYAGIGEDHHKPGTPIASCKTREALDTNTVIFQDGDHETYSCALDPANCPVGSVLIVPLTVGNEPIGAIKLYEPKNRRFLRIHTSLGEGIARFMSAQLSLVKLEEQQNLLLNQELKLVQAQVNPHFLFNTLNTIISVVRVDPELAASLLQHLSNFFRKNLKRGEDFSTLAEEIDHVNSYLFIEQARFADRLTVDIDIDDDLRDLRLPTFTLQPFVENAIKHGISNIMGPGTVKITGRRENGSALITVEDNAGVYVSNDGDGHGMKIVERRIKGSCGTDYGIDIDVKDGEYTKVTLNIPACGCAS